MWKSLMNCIQISPPPLIDEPVKKIADKNGTEHQLKNNH